MHWRSASPDRYELLKQFAKENRKNMTEAESAFWLYAKEGALGEKVVRQHIIGDYIVDFMLRKSQIIVEIDGGYHGERNRTSLSSCIGRLYDPTIEVERVYTDQVEADRIRQDWLEANGYRVIRFTNEEILFDIDSCILKIKDFINEKR